MEAGEVTLPARVLQFTFRDRSAEVAEAAASRLLLPVRLGRSALDGSCLRVQALRLSPELVDVDLRLDVLWYLPLPAASF